MLFVDRPLGRLTIIEQYWKLAMARKGKNKSSTERAREEKSDCVGLFVLVPTCRRCARSGAGGEGGTAQVECEETVQHTPPYALVLVLARGTLCRCQGAYCSEVTVVHAADRSGPMCTPIGADDGREKSAPQTRSQRYHAWCALFVGCPARTQAGCAPAVGSPKRNYNCTGHKLPLSFSGASTTRGREKQRRGRIYWPPKHRFLATLQHSGAYRRTCTTPPVARPACGAPACFFFPATPCGVRVH